MNSYGKLKYTAMLYRLKLVCHAFKFVRISYVFLFKARGPSVLKCISDCVLILGLLL